MTRANLLGAFFSLLLFSATFLIWETRFVFFNITALVVVVFGTIATAFLAFPFHQLQNACSVAFNSYRPFGVDPRSIIAVLLDMAMRSRREGILSLQEKASGVTLSFLQNGLDVLVDGYSEDEIYEILSTESSFFRLRRQHSERIFRILAKTAPAFGVAGSVIGLIGMLAGIQDTSVIFQTIPMALVSTLYGLIISNLFLLPVAENIVSRTQEELLLQKIILEGILAIKKEQNPLRLEKRLCAFLSPQERQAAQADFQDKKQRYLDLLRTKKEATQK